MKCSPLPSIVALVAGLVANAAQAQLTDETQTTPHVPGGAIARSLEEQVGAGHGDELTYGSSVYLIKRDPARSIRRGRQLFQRKFTADQGMGPRVRFDSSGDIRETRAFGAGLVDSCAGCHGRPRGAAGFGGDVVTRPDSRDAPHLFGLGLQEMLADEITADLRAIRDETVATAVLGIAAQASEPERCDRRSRGCNDDSRSKDRPRNGDHNRSRDRKREQGSDPGGNSGGSHSGGAVTRPLLSKGISYGWITAFPDGSVDLSRVEGIDEDLRIRPFFAEGGTISIREFVVGAFKAEMGLEAPDSILCDVTHATAPTPRVSPAGFAFDPAHDLFERPPVCGPSDDGDGDGVVNEVDMALVDHMEFYLLNYFKPAIGRGTSGSRQGRSLMNQLKCTSCHVPDLVIQRDRRVADVETVHDPVRGIFNRLFATASTRFHVVPDGLQYPQLLPLEEPFVVRNIFTDFKRHDLGEAFHEREYDGDVQTRFITEPLWGVGSTAPYGHDGRSINLEEVILRHGGEAQASRDAFTRLRPDDQRKLLEFLQTLVLFPPDDTASNLNPGKPGANPQLPENHGSINLGALFQIPGEGPE
jgi:hypothetical protein